ncbi:MAG: site-specific DNA-methyltransferase, partial [Actinobacteria bacterium]|nr:site-specific DNA-methyltransferase [Actinomycetota bacterium]
MNKLTYETNKVKLYAGSNLEILPTLPDNSVDSIVTDPPYELGFMNKTWDSTGIAYSIELWRECLRVLKPAHEPIVVARKPLIGTVAENVLQHGVGGMNIDASRIGTETIVNGYG